ncbi:ExbD/TolR family protein [Desulfurivibrio alkaliphilus]|uniref:Biopolymer transport protein ExbD/TolR n=1 Tax=Desulfurivibrio alkaliphilus (strain DSM 19089 / UNIQEM U267 / AHT2) TaxID=589865 RepID=D6Z1X1_DESAT|nr:biopolymer transporter ExbD [Desulfurivibrio alkaliphilus]ADH85546.1 Biopolymer transport protein ExbD/TolR [Desulfurivibrio alkaliphilus AHT 2]
MDEQGFNNMNVIPLVDVMLVLLVIVLTTSTFIAAGAIPVQLPEAASSEAAPLEPSTIEVDARGNLYLEAREVSLAELRRSLGHKERSLPILIKADRSIALQTFVEVMDVVKELGFTRVSLQTEKIS